MNVGFVSLGCSKNLVDTEMMIGVFEKENFKIVSDPKDADIIVVNTCGFIGKAKEEAINTLLEMAEYKKNKCKYLVATGCLVERYKEELKKEMPEVDLFIKFSEYSTFWQQIVEGLHLDLSKNATENKSKKIYDIQKKKKKNDDAKIDNTKSDNATVDNKKDYNKLDFNNREISTGNNYAYLRIADGCDMTKGRARIPLSINNTPKVGDIHKYSASAIERVSIKPGERKPIKITIEMSAEVGFFQIEEVLLTKVNSSPAKIYVELYAGVTGQECKCYL